MTSKRSRTDFEADGSSPHNRPPFVSYGTPLPALDSQTRDDGSYVPVWKQEVRDEQGRKRLHGAFTGGFSAGYFNTVGSKEGWTPSTFVSSRTNRRRDEGARKAEDLMDAEDLADLHESQRLETKETYAKLGFTQNDGGNKDLLAGLFRGENDGMGVKLLQRMGWKRGQGLGPKVRRSARVTDAVTTDGQETHLFAPDDVPMISFDRKTDKHGLGWMGDVKLGGARGKMASRQLASQASDSDGEEELFAVRKKPVEKRKQRKSGFGVGVLNDTGSDEDDAYQLGPRISYNRFIGGDRKRSKEGLVTSTHGSSQSTSSIPRAKSLANNTGAQTSGRCHDGRLPLDGFILATMALDLSVSQRYAPPVIPIGWKPSRLTSDSVKGTIGFASTSDAAKVSTLDVKQRAALLGEATLPGKSIFDYISPEARNKLAEVTGANLPQGRGESAPAGFEETPAQKQRSLLDLVPRIDHATADAALSRSVGSSGWMPYAEDQAKRMRYMAYLSVMTGQRTELPPRKEGSTIDEWGAEMKEFAQAAMVFRPVSGLMASRFTTAKSDPNKPIVSAAKTEDLGGTEAVGGLAVVRPRASDQAEDPAEQAARLGMYGPLTRSTADFYPTRLTCKRFGVQTPAHVLNGPDEGKQSDKFEVVGRDKLEEMRSAATAAAAATKSSPDTVGTEGPGTIQTNAPASGPPTRLPQTRAEIDVERNDALEGRRAGEELFKSIFGDDDDDDDDDA